MKFVKRVADFRIYELDQRECKEHFRAYPCFVCWEEKPGTINDDIGNMHFTENESETIEEMEQWCEENR